MHGRFSWTVTWLFIRHNERHLCTIATTHLPDRPHTFQAFVFANAPGATASLRNEGYVPVRHFYGIVRDTLTDLPDAPLPSGLEVRPIQLTHYRAIWAADQAAFHDHWGFNTGYRGGLSACASLGAGVD